MEVWAALSAGYGDSSWSLLPPFAATTTERTEALAAPAAVIGDSSELSETANFSNSSQQQQQQQRLVDLTGLWAKDEARSDLAAYERSLEVLGLSGLQRVTAKLIDGIEIQQEADSLSVSFVTVVPFFKVTERIPIGGGGAQMGRRDLRRGKQTAAARPVDGGVLVEMSWGEPLAGTLTEEYSLLPDGSGMRVRATTSVGGRSVTADSVYVRSSSKSKEDLLKQRGRST